MAASSKQECLHRARSLLANINGRKLKGDILQDSEQAAETLGCTIDLLQNLQSLLVRETIPLEPASSDWNVLKALLELLVRLGIFPHLNPGVGILRDKRQDDCSNISFQLSGLSISSSLLQSTALARLAGMPLLFLCAEALGSFIWTRSSPHVTPSSSISTSQSEKTGDADIKTTDTTILKLEDTCLGDFGTYGSPIENYPGVQMIVSSPVQATCSLIGMNLHDGTQLMPFPSTSQLVMKCFLWDLMAAYLQLAFAPCETNEDIRHQARARLKLMVEQFPVERMVVASFVLLNRGSPTPPPWIKAELGKQLSKLVMRGEGLVTILKELVGRVTKGNVESYAKVASHMAKVPKSVATPDEYLDAICPQLLPLLLKHKPRDSVVGEISLAAFNNVFHTSVSLACKIFSMEPKLASKYMVQPIMRPLLALKSMQNSMDIVGSVSSKVAEGDEHNQVLVMENEVVDSLVQMSVLLTAGSSAARELILLDATVVAPLLLRLHCNLAAINHSFPTINTKTFASPDSKSRALEGKGGVAKGFLHKGLSLGGSSEQAYEEDSNLLKLKSSLADVAMAGINQPVEHALPCILPFMLEQRMNALRWSQEEGEVWEALQLGGSQLRRSKARYLSQLLLTVENWPLVLAIMEKLLHKILNLRQSLLKGDGGSGAVELLGYMQDFEELNNEAGSKALEYDTCGAASLVKALLEDELVLHDEDMVEVVLHMVYSVMKGIKAATADGSQKSHVHGSALNDLLSALQRIYANASVGNNPRQMAFTLAEEISALRKTR